MKKILTLLLLTLICFLFAEEPDRDIYMPEKLVHAELPEDVSEDMEYLLRSNYEFYKEIYKQMQDTDKSLRNIPGELINKIPEEEAKRIAYLAWYARHTMPQYFGEYAVINSGYVNTFLGHDEELDRKLHEVSYVVQFFGDRRVNRNLYGLIPLPSEEISRSVIYKIWIKAKVISSDVITVQRFGGIFDGEKRKTSIVNIEITDDISGIFPYDELTIECYYSGPEHGHKYQSLLEEGKEYLIPLRWTLRTHTRPSNEDGHYYPIVYPSAALNECMLIQDGYLTTFDLKEYARKIGFIPSGDYWTRKLFGEQISYDQAREIVRSNIDKLIECGGVR